MTKPNLSVSDPRNLYLALKAKSYGMQNSLRTVIEAKRAGLPVSLGFAMVEQESGDGSNVFGHDQTIFAGRGKVTKALYIMYKAMRKSTGKMQGVGPLQLTWWELQDEADRLGGCWIPKYNLRVGFTHLADLIKQYGKSEGIRRYNGSGDAAYVYAKSVLAREAKWHARLK